MPDTTLTTKPRWPHEKDQQEALLEALDASPRALRRDECGWWIIKGADNELTTTPNHVGTWGDGRTWFLFVVCRSPQHWTWTKKALSFCEVTQDGDDEGVLRLHALPTPEQAVIIRERLGIPKYRHLSPEELERLRAMGAEYAFRPRGVGTETERP